MMGSTLLLRGYNTLKQHSVPRCLCNCHLLSQAGCLHSYLAVCVAHIFLTAGLMLTTQTKAFQLHRLVGAQSSTEHVTFELF